MGPRAIMANTSSPPPSRVHEIELHDDIKYCRIEHGLDGIVIYKRSNFYGGKQAKHSKPRY